MGDTPVPVCFEAEAALIDASGDAPGVDVEVVGGEPRLSRVSGNVDLAFVPWWRISADR